MAKEGKNQQREGSFGKICLGILVGTLIMIIVVVASGVTQPIKMAKTIAYSVAKTGAKAGIGMVKDSYGNMSEFFGNVTTGIFGNANDHSPEPVKNLQDAVDTYSIEDLIKYADDEDVVTDEALKGMMLERSSFKRLLQAVYKKNNSYKSDTISVEAKHTYTTVKVLSFEDYVKQQTEKESSSSSETKKSNDDTDKKKTKAGGVDPFIPVTTPSPSPSYGPGVNTDTEDDTTSKPEDKEDVDSLEPTPTPIETKAPEKTETEESDDKVSVKEKHTEYVWRTIYVSTEDMEGQYKLDYQPILLSTMQSFIKNFGSLSGLTKASEETDSSNTPNSNTSNSATQNVDSSTEGGKIAAYALKFLGNPYVYGGTSLTKGCDCSGFVMKVYEHFGYSLPHSSDSMLKSGKLVCDKSNYNQALLQEGDIVCYDGHVGIYIGNGKIVNASNSKVGIVIYKIMYRDDFMMVRRVANGKSQKNTKVAAGSISATRIGTANKDNYTVTAVSKSTDSTNPYEGADSVLVGNDVPSKMWNFFKAKGLSDIAVAAILGNCQQESNFNVKSHSDGTSFWGLFQWGENSDTKRWAELKKRYPGGEFELINQLKYTWWEMTESGRRNTLPILSRATHLDYISKSDPGATWIWAKYFEGYTGELDKRTNYAKVWLKKFGGKNGTVTDGKQFNASDVGLDDAGESYASPQVFGTYDKETGMVTLTDEEINTIIEDFTPEYSYDYDVVSDSKKKYTYEEAQTMKNKGKENDGGDESTENGIYEWYAPTSTLTSAKLPYGDVTYDGNEPSTYEFNESRWNNIMSRYVAYYDKRLFIDMVETLPNGIDFTGSFEYFKSLSEGSVSSTTSNTENVSNADGEYEAMGNVKPSIKIPKNAGGMSIPLYLQYDSRWSNVKFCGNTIATSGCSATSLAMVMSYMKQKCIYPDDIVAWTGAKKYYSGSAGASWNIFTDVAKHWGFGCKQQTVNESAIIKALKGGNPVIVSTSGYGTTQEFTKAGHFIVLRGLNSKGQVLVNDPNDNSTTKSHYLKAYSAKFIVSECTMNGSTRKPMWIFSKN